MISVAVCPECKTARLLRVQLWKQATLHHTAATQFNLNIRLDEDKAGISLNL